MRTYLDTRTDRLVTSRGTQSLLATIEVKHTPVQTIEIQTGESADDSSDGFGAAASWTGKLLGLNTTFVTDFATDANVLTLPNSDDFSNDDQVYLVSATTLPAPLVADTFYFVVNKSSLEIELSLTQGGAAITLTDDGTGIHTIYRKPGWVVGFKEDTDYDGAFLTSQTTFTLDSANFLWCFRVDLTTAAIRTLLDRDGVEDDDIASITGAMFEVLYREDTDAIEWRPQINPVSATIHNSVADTSLAVPD